MRKNMFKFFSILVLAVVFTISGNSEADAALLNNEINLPKINCKFFDELFNWKESIDARGGRSGGGRGGSFGRSRSSSPSRPSAAPRSSTPSRTSAPALRSTPSKSPSFGGRRVSPEQARASYGVPRRTQTMTSNNQLGQSTNYRVNDYGGFSSGLMMGYMMGSMPWYMHGPAMFYSRPVYVEQPDGSVDVYPPSFSFGKLILAIIVIALIIFIIKKIIFAKRRLKAQASQSSFM
jgi:hypothetical protein